MTGSNGQKNIFLPLAVARKVANVATVAGLSRYSIGLRPPLRISAGAARVASHVAKIIIDGRTIGCSTPEVRQLLLEAKAIGDDEPTARHFSIGRLMLIKDACQLHCLARNQRLGEEGDRQAERHSA